MFDSYEWDYFVGFFREFARVRLTGNWTFSKKKKKVQKRRRGGDFATDKCGHDESLLFPVILTGRASPASCVNQRTGTRTA